MPKAVVAIAIEKPKRGRKIDPLKIALATLKAGRPKQGLAVYGVVNADGKIVHTQFTGCHATLGDAHFFGQAPRAIFSWVPKPSVGLSKEAFEHWSDYLAHRSPWTKVMIAGLPTELVMNEGVVCPTNVPANFLVNLLIATRMPCEHPNHVKKWHELVEAGAQEDLAVIFACMMGGGNKIAEHSGNGHHPFDCFTNHIVKNFVNHDYANPNPIYEKARAYHPCSGGWDEKGAEYANDYGMSKDRKYFFTLKKLYDKAAGDEGRMFKVRANGETPIEHTLKEWVDIINVEHKRLKNVEEAQAQAGGDNRAKAPVGVRKRAVRGRGVLAHVKGRVPKGRKD
jgi:hypothetical protein